MGNEKTAKPQVALSFRGVKLAAFERKDIEMRIPITDGKVSEIFRVPMSLDVEIPRMDIFGQDRLQVEYSFAYRPGAEGAIRKMLEEENESLAGLASKDPELAEKMRGCLVMGTTLGTENPDNLQIVSICYVCADRKLFDEKGGSIVKALGSVGDRFRDKFEPKGIEKTHLEGVLPDFRPLGRHD
jgi:hypothetical protein